MRSRKLPAILLSLAIAGTCMMPASAGEMSGAMEEWMPYAIEQLQEAGMSDEDITSFLEQIASNPDFAGLSVWELNAWLQEILSAVRNPDMSEDEMGIAIEQMYDQYKDVGSDDDSSQGSDSQGSEDAFDDGASGDIFDSGSHLSPYMDSSGLSYLVFEVQDKSSYLDYLNWLTDYTTNVLVPQAVEKLLQIPVFAQAAEEGMLSKYINLALTYDPQIGYSAMVAAAALGRDGSSVDEIEDPIGNLAYALRINLSENTPEIRTDDRMLMQLEDFLLHEMTHAFMNDCSRNGMIGTDRTGVRSLMKNEDGTTRLDADGDPVQINAFPFWFCEGTATSVQAGYATRRNELLDFFGDHEDRDDVLNTLTDRSDMMFCLTLGGEKPRPNNASLLDTGNGYNVGYVACMYLYSMAARKLGLEPVIESDTGIRVNEDVLLMGMNDILVKLKNGMSLDQIIAFISLNEETGTSLYADTKSFEERFAQDIEEPGLVFWQSLMLAYESLSSDPSVYLPAGSVLPGYKNYAVHYLDRERHEQPRYYAVTVNPDPDTDRDCFAVSTVQPSLTALGGGRSISYDAVQDQLSPEEKEQFDTYNIGDQVIFATLDD